MKSGADRAKQKFPCNKCKQLGHWAAECRQKQQYAGNRSGKLAVKKNTDAFLVHVMGASRASSVDADTWYCDSGATRHITPNRNYFVIYKICQSWNNRAWQEKCADASIGQGTINVQMFHNGIWHDAILKNVRYVPDASAHLFSVKAAAQNGTAQPWMKKLLFVEVMELLQHRVRSLTTCMHWRFGCVFHNTLQRSTWQRKWEHCKYGMNVLVIKISVMLWKCWSNMALMWKQTKNFVTGVLWERHIGRASELGQADQT